MARTLPLILRAVAALSLASAATAQTFTDVTPGSGLAAIPASVSVYGIGACCADFDSDGDLDLVVPLGAGQAVQLFYNQGNMSFASAGSVGRWP